MRPASLRGRFLPMLGIWLLVGCGPDATDGEPAAEGGTEPAAAVATPSQFAPTPATANPVKCTPGIPGNGFSRPIPENKGRLIHIPGAAGRKHALWVFASPVARTVTIEEVAQGEVDGLEIEVTPPSPSGEPWAYLRLDAAGCAVDPAEGARIVNTTTGMAPFGGFDSQDNYAFAILTGNSTYILSAPVSLDFELDSEAPPAR